MYYQRIFAQIFEDTIQNRIVCDDYEMANYLARATYGETALAVECNQYKVGIGDKYRDGIFYQADGETPAEYIPTHEEEMERLSEELETEKKSALVLRTAATFAAASFTDSQALAVKDLYPDWSKIPDGTHLEAGQRVRYNGNLYKVRTGQAHDKQSTWTPTDAASLFEAIDEAHAGTLEDPIPAVANMQYYEGKYYSEGDTVYLCTKDTGIPIAQLPSTLVGIYFSIAEV